MTPDLPIPAAVAGPLVLLDEERGDVVSVGDADVVLRLPKFREHEIPRSSFARLPQHLARLTSCTGVPAPRLLTYVESNRIDRITQPEPLAYTLVERVHGVPLDLAVQDNAVPAEVVESALAGIGRYLREGLSDGLEIMEDVPPLSQYSWGTVGDSTEQLWFIDVEPRYVCMCGDHSWADKLFLMQVAELIRSVLTAEAGLGSALPAARTSLGTLLTDVEALDPEASAEMRDTWQTPGSDGGYYRARWFRSH